MIKGIQAIRAYGGSRIQEEAVIARNVNDPEVQVRIAKNSKNRLVLLNLALNNNLDEKAVQELYDRDISYLTRRLDNLGYKEKNFLGF